MTDPACPLPASPAYALVVDDHPLVAHGIAAFLRTQPRLADAATAGSAAEALDHVRRHGAPAIALVDFWMADGASTPFFGALRALAPAVRLLAMSGDGHDTVRQSARDHGAHGFLHKQEPPEGVARAVAALLDGGTWFTAPAGSAQSWHELPVTAAGLGLTPRQGDVLARLLDGQPNKQIARELHLSEHTVKEHVTAVLQRLGVRSRVAAIAKLRGARLHPGA